MIFWSSFSVYKHLKRRKRRGKSLFQPSILGVGETILDLSDCAKRLIVRAEAIFLPEQLQLLVRSILIIGRGDKNKEEI